MILTFRHKKYRTFHEQHEMNGSFNGRNVHCAVETKLFYINVLFFVPRIVIQLCTFFFFVGQRLFFHSLGRGSCVETFFPSFLWSASAAYSLWTIISNSLCETAFLRYIHMGNPLYSVNYDELRNVIKKYTLFKLMF